MDRFIENYTGEQFDLLVIGGGITGAAVAYDAASRGLSVALVEKQDFGGATSAATSKLIHGGFRYLAQGDLHLVWESLSERRTLENIAPNFVYPLPVMITGYNSQFSNTMWVMKAGMIIYDVLSYNKSWTWDRSKSLPRHKSLSAEQALALEPTIKKEGLKGAFVFYDSLSLFPERLTLAFIKSAVKHGARVANYAKVEGFILTPGRSVRGLRVRDLLTNQTVVDLYGSLTINCGGPWADIILGLATGGDISRHLRRSEGIHVITKKLVKNHMVASVTSDGRHCFLIPWRGHTLIGTTDKEYTGDPDAYAVTKASVLELLDEVNSSFGLRDPLRYEDAQYVYGGLRPLVEKQTKEVYRSSRKYEIHDNAQDGIDGLITVEGGKYTTSRKLADKVMKMAAKKLNRDVGACITDKQYLAGCEIENIDGFLGAIASGNKDIDGKTMKALGTYYGTEYSNVLALARSDRNLSEPLNSDGEIPAQVLFGVRHEMARTLPDVLLRRTGIGTLGIPGDAVLARVADIVAQELQWDSDRKQKELSGIGNAYQVHE
ncbi:MAG TPA: glycerol-3-phosphate dehydrogenase [Nitrospiraceae bacterium]|nr:glycerol-3-phosphate dehydrogenase [Nitrospiraceae bacterium]